MKKVIKKLYNALKEITECDVFYGTNNSVKNPSDKVPFIVYQELYRNTIFYGDNQSLLRSITFQVTLVTESKDLDIEEKLEKKLTDNDYRYTLLSEFVSPEGSITRNYEIKQEVNV
ncbi:hypothetical protein [Liberiplasma polymorphum]|uniref:hypothetical protein n=1 Tax=Liberiplasma polymorphum TaxID=3374570 RepID=UPI003772DED0